MNCSAVTSPVRVVAENRINVNTCIHLYVHEMLIFLHHTIQICVFYFIHTTCFDLFFVYLVSLCNFYGYEMYPFENKNIICLALYNRNNIKKFMLVISMFTINLIISLILSEKICLNYSVISLSDTRYFVCRF